jgi:hypothetical protein
MIVMVIPWACAGEKKGIARTVKKMPPKIKRLVEVIRNIVQVI